jgi:DNA-binding IclR family transcriptional regulator
VRLSSASRWGVDARTARRMMRALAAEQYVQREVVAERASPKWTSTPRLLALAAQLSRRLPLVVDGDNLVRKLAVGDRSAWLCIPAYADVLALAAAGSRAPAPWTLTPAAECVTGRLLLAHRDGWRRSLGEQSPVMTESDADRIRLAGY